MLGDVTEVQKFSCLITEYKNTCTLWMRKSEDNWHVGLDLVTQQWLGEKGELLKLILNMLKK